MLHWSPRFGTSTCFKKYKEILIEEYIPGREIQVANLYLNLIAEYTFVLGPVRRVKKSNAEKCKKNNKSKKIKKVKKK